MTTVPRTFLPNLGGLDLNCLVLFLPTRLTKK